MECETQQHTVVPARIRVLVFAYSILDRLDYHGVFLERQSDDDIAGRSSEYSLMLPYIKGYGLFSNAFPHYSHLYT
jgi:hypothetical protein